MDYGRVARGLLRSDPTPEEIERLEREAEEASRDLSPSTSRRGRVEAEGSRRGRGINQISRIKATIKCKLLGPTQYAIGRCGPLSRAGNALERGRNPWTREASHSP